MIVDELDRKLRVKDKKQYCEGASVDDIIEGRRTFRIEDKLNADKYSASFVQPVSGHEVTVSFLADNFTAPLIIKDKDGLGIKIPSEDFTVDDVKKAVGPRRTIDVMDVTTQQALTMSMEKWTRYYNEPIEKRTRTYNVLSLEFSRSRLDRIVEQPRVVKHLDWVETVWPRYLKRKQRETTNLMDKMYYPKVQKYCLMSVAGCYTDFHIDMGGTSVWYHILKGAKTFWLIPPTAKNLALYEKWTLSMKQGDEFFGDKVGPGQCQRITLRPGCTFFIPTGWIHAVHTPVDSLVFGGNFLHSFGIDMQLRIWNMESTTHVPMKFRYPFFTEMHWYVLDRFLQNHTGKSYREKPKKAIKDLDQLTCVGDTCDAVSHDDVIVTSSRIGIDALDTSSQASSDGGKFRKHEEESSSKEKHCRQQHDESQSAANGISRRRSRSSNSLDDDDNSNQNGDQNGGPTGHQNGGHCDVSVTRERKNLIGLFGEEAGMRSVLEFLEKLPSNKRCVPTDIPDPEGLLKHAKAFLSGNDAGLTNTVGDKSLSKNQKNTTLRALQEKVKRAIKQKQTISNISRMNKSRPKKKRCFKTRAIVLRKGLKYFERVEVKCHKDQGHAFDHGHRKGHGQTRMQNHAKFSKLQHNRVLKTRPEVGLTKKHSKANIKDFKVNTKGPGFDTRMMHQQLSSQKRSLYKWTNQIKSGHIEESTNQKRIRGESANEIEAVAGLLGLQSSDQNNGLENPGKENGHFGNVSMQPNVAAFQNNVSSLPFHCDTYSMDCSKELFLDCENISSNFAANRFSKGNSETSNSQDYKGLLQTYNHTVGMRNKFNPSYNTLRTPGLQTNLKNSSFAHQACNASAFSRGNLSVLAHPNNVGSSVTKNSSYPSQLNSVKQPYFNHMTPVHSDWSRQSHLHNQYASRDASKQLQKNVAQQSTNRMTPSFYPPRDHDYSIKSCVNIIVQDLVRCHVCQRKVKDELDDVMSENQYGCLSDIRECAGCYKIVHPACFQKAYPEYGFSGVMLEDLTYTWLCPKCIEDNVQSDLFMKSRDFDKSHDQDHSSMTSSDFVSEDEAPGKTRNRSKVEDNDRIEYRHSSSNYFALHGLSRKRVRVEIWPRNCPDVEEFSYRKRRRNASWCEKSELENKAQNSIVGECRPTSGESNDDGKRKYCNSEISIRRDEPMDSERLSLPSLRICVQRCDETQTNTEHTRECAKSVPSPLLETNELDNIEMTTPKVNDAGTDSVKARCISPKIFYPPSSLTSKELRANTQPTADSIKSTSLSATSQFIETNQPVTLDHVLKTIDIKTVPIHNRTCLAKHFTRTTNSKNSSMSQILKEKESSCLTQPNAKVRAVTTKEINSNTIVIHTTCYPKGNTNAPWCNTNEGLTIDTGTGMSENRLSISAPTSPNGGISAGGFSPKVFYPPTPSVSPKSCQSSPSFKSPRTDTNQSECTLPNGQSGVMESAKPKFSCDMDDSHINRSSSEQVKVNPSVHVDFDVKQTPMEISQTVVGYNVEQTDIFHKNSAIDIEANSPKDHEAKEKSRTECNFKQIGRPGNQRSSGEYEVRSSTLELNHRSHKSLYYSQRSSVVVPKTPEVNQRSTVGNTDTPTNTPPSEWKEKSTRAVLSSLPTPPHTPPFRMGSLWAKEQAMLSILKQPRPSEKSDFSTGIKEMAPVTQTIPRGNIFSNLVAHSQHTKEVVSAKVPQFSNDQDFVFARKESKVLPTIQEKRKPGLDDILNDYFNQNVQDSSQNNYVATNAGDTFYGTQRAEKNDRKDASILGDSTNISGDVYASNSCPSVVVSVAPVMDTSDNEGATQQLNQSTVPKVADNPSGTGNTSDNNKHGSKDSSGGDSSANHPNSASANSGQSSSRSGHVAGRIGSGGSGDGGGDDDDEDGDDRKKRNKKGVPDDATGDQNDKEDSETEEEEENNKNKHDNAHCNTGKRTGRGSNRKRSIDGPSSHSNLSVSPSAGGKEDRDGSTETTPKKIAKKQSPKLGISIKLKHVDCTAENGGEGEIKTPIPAKSSSGKKRKNANKSATTPQSAKRSLKTGSDGTKSSGKSALSGTLRTPSTGKKGKWNIKKEPSTPPSYEDTSCSAITAFAGGNSVASNNSSKKTKDIAQCHKIPDLKPPRALVQKYSVRPAPIPPPPEKVQMSSGQDHPLDRKAWMAVFSWLSPGSLLRCSQACKTFHRWALHHTLWQRMNFSNTHLTQAHIVAIVKRQPVWLDLSWSNISYRKLDWLVPRLPHLRHLDLSGSSWAGVCALCSPSCPLLLSLDLSWVSGLINGCVRDLVSPPVEHRPGVDHSLSRLRNCTTLSLRGANITTLIFPIIAQNLPALTTLQLDFCVKLTDDSVATVAKEMPNLKVLCLSRCHGLSSAVFACVKQIKNLERLEINNCLQISSQDVRGFARDVGAMLDENTGVLVFNLS